TTSSATAAASWARRSRMLVRIRDPVHAAPSVATVATPAPLQPSKVYPPVLEKPTRAERPRRLQRVPIRGFLSATSSTAAGPSTRNLVGPVRDPRRRKIGR